MLRINLHRGIMAMVFAAALGLAGARPAAAQGPVWREAMDWLGKAWSSMTSLVPALPERLHAASESCGLGGAPCPPPDPAPQGDCGLEIDPNGRCRV